MVYFIRLSLDLKKYCRRSIKHKTGHSSLNMNHIGFRNRSAVTVYSITCIYVNYLVEGRSLDQKLASVPETLIQKTDI